MSVQSLVVQLRLKGGEPGPSGFGTELGRFLGLVAGTGGIGREDLGCWGQGAELKLVSCVLSTGPVLSPTPVGVGWGNLSSLQPRPQGTRATLRPLPQRYPRGFSCRQAARVLGALGKAARPSACALARGLTGQCRGEGWLVAWPGRAGRGGMQIRTRATGWAIIDSARPGSGPEEGGWWRGREGRGAGARGLTLGGGLEVWRQEHAELPSGAVSAPARLLTREPGLRLWTLLAPGRPSPRVCGAELCGVGVG